MSLLLLSFVTRVYFADLSQISSDNPHKAELDDMLHDLPLFEHIAELTSQLRMKYQGLSVQHVNGLMRSLQINIQQKSDVNKSSIQLSIPTGCDQKPRMMYINLK